MQRDAHGRRDAGPDVEDERRREHGSQARHGQVERDVERAREAQRGAPHASSQPHPQSHAGRQPVDERASEGASYEGWSRDQLYDKARELGLEGRSKMTKSELLQALRRH